MIKLYNFLFSVPIKVKKVDLPVVPESEILPSLDDAEEALENESEDDEIDENEDEMVADEPIDNMEEEEMEDDYDSEEALDQDFVSDNGNNYNYNNWDTIINSSQIIIKDKESTTQSPTTSSSVQTTASQAATLPSMTPEKSSILPIEPVSGNDGASATAVPTPDPYFTHFDPRMEHQSYKVGLDVKTKTFDYCCFFCGNYESIVLI